MLWVWWIVYYNSLPCVRQALMPLSSHSSRDEWRQKFDSQGWIKGWIQNLAEKWTQLCKWWIALSISLNTYSEGQDKNGLVHRNFDAHRYWALKLYFFFCFILAQHAHTTSTHTAIKITLSPQSLRALMPALYSLSINKIRPCAFQGPAGNKKTVCNSQENLVQTARTFTLHWKHCAQVTNRHVQQWKNQWNSLGRGYRKDKNQTMIWDKGV